MSRKINSGFATRAIHIGQTPDPSTGAVVPPLHLTSTYAQEDFAVHKGYDYSRATNPTRSALEANLASLEGAKYAATYASGMAALTALLTHFKVGDHFIISENVYGGTFRLMTEIFNRYGFEATWVDPTRQMNFAKEILPTTRAIIVETPSNPMMTLTDIRDVADLAHANNLMCIVDNTFMSPYCQRPMELGADAVFHSITKYLGGHSDIIAGVVMTSNDELAEDMLFIQKSVGAIPSPFECWLIQRSLKTLAVRMEQHNRNAQHLAEILEGLKGIEQVFYPGLPSHPQHELATTQQRTPKGEPAFGGMISFDAGSLEKARKIATSLEIFTLAESLGGVESLINHPAMMTHASVPREKRESFGLTDGILRLSVGIENIEDLEADLIQAVESAI